MVSFFEYLEKHHAGWIYGFIKYKNGCEMTVTTGADGEEFSNQMYMSQCFEKLTALTKLKGVDWCAIDTKLENLIFDYSEEDTNNE